MNYRGYCETLPIKKGDTVIIRKGTTINSFNPSKLAYTAKKDTKVNVNHVLCGSCISASLVDRHDILFLESAGYDEEIRKQLNDLYWHEIQRVGYDSVNHQRYAYPVTNPSVVWAGTGGYWCEVDINEVL